MNFGNTVYSFDELSVEVIINDFIEDFDYLFGSFTTQVSGIKNTILEGIYEAVGVVLEEVLVPVLTYVTNVVVNVISDLILDALAALWLQIWVVFLMLIDFTEQIFGMFIGLSSVGLNDVSINKSFLDYLFELDSMRNAILAITLISFILVFVATIIGVAKSMSDMTIENKNPISKVLSQSIRATLTVLMIPFACAVVITMSTQLLVIIDSEISGAGSEASIGDVMFSTIASPAAKSDAIAQKYASGKAYTDSEGIKDDFVLEDIDYIVAYTSSIFVFVVLAALILQSIQRIIMVLVLYLISPLIAATMPLDNGQMFRTWRNMFTGFMISAFAPVISMNIYFMAISSLVGGTQQISFGQSELAESMIRVIFIMGGAYAVYKSRNLVIRVIDPGVAAAIAQTGVVATAMKAVAKATATAVKSAALVATQGGSAAAGAAMKGASTAGKAASAASTAASAASSAASSAFQTQDQAYSGK